MLSAYRRFCAANSSAGQLILPESLKLMPLYLSCATKHPAFVVNKLLGRPAAGRAPLADAYVRADRRAEALAALMCAPAHRLVPALYPRFFRVDALPDEAGVPPAATPIFAEHEDPRDAPLPAEALLQMPLPPSAFPSFAQVASDGVYVLDAQAHTLLLVAPDAADAVLAQLFAAPSAAALARDGPPLRGVFNADDEHGRRLRNIVQALRARRGNAAAPLRLLCLADPAQRQLALEACVEDVTPCGGSGARSYVDFLCSVHSTIQSRMAA